ncbi:antibiotic biosynthesis monooxygenase family protein [Desulfospira joergensenii]|uniref:antibiotic biosynthesis monooxygenase family protein n=1 Tax=Desulfospira joergensenii TaxID=53329 RepID=UPI0003B3D8DB|nr:antibiotic biosynthesis monooxygenase [Desulfospira joergensenii]
MIRIAYKWKVQKSNQEKFKTAWAKATSKIRASKNGARGSVLLHSHQDSTEFLTIARWDTIESWQQFWKSPLKKEMQPMHDIAERLSVDVFEEIEDFTI